MALMNNQWQKVDRRDRGDDGVLEYFMKGEFITFDKWEKNNLKDFPSNHPYLKDSFEFKRKLYKIDIKNEIRVSEFIHVTLCERAVSIIKDCGFRPGTKNMPGIGELNLIWFGLKVKEEQIDSLRMNYKQCAYDQLKCEYFVTDRLANCVANAFADESANTTPFQPMSRYGNVKFTLSITEVLSQYKRQFCANGSVIYQPEMRKLGTFAYRKETMHVVLVCSPFDSFARDLPALDSDDPIIIDDEGIFTWSPHSIGEKSITFHTFLCNTQETLGLPFKWDKRWEHVTFAFVVPKGHCLYIPNLDNHVSLCLHLTKEFKIFCIHNAIFNMLYLIQREEKSDIRQNLANMLIRMIYFNCEEWPLYQKTVSRDNFEVRGDLIVQDEWITSSFKAMLPMEAERLIWPHPNKMNGLSIILNYH